MNKKDKTSELAEGSLLGLYLGTEMSEELQLKKTSVSDDDDFNYQLTQIRPGNFPVYSTKVFIGGLLTMLIQAKDVIGNFFKRYGPNFVDWPHRNCCNVAAPRNGYVFVIFKNEHAVRRLIYASDIKQGKLFIDMKDGDVLVKTVRLWYLSGSSCTLLVCVPLAYRYSVFVADIPRTVTTTELARLFDNIINSVLLLYFTLTTTDGRKVILELRPYMLDRMLCEICYEAAGVYLCPYLPCFLYYCVSCWNFIYQYSGMTGHKSVSKRNLRFFKQNYIFHLHNNSMRRRYHHRFYLLWIFYTIKRDCSQSRM
ncbi:putative integral membrane protein [Brugia pahangi]